MTLAISKKSLTFTAGKQYEALHLHSAEVQFQYTDTEAHHGAQLAEGLVCHNRAKDGYFHIYIVQRLRKFPGLSFEGKVYLFFILCNFANKKGLKLNLYHCLNQFGRITLI